MFQEFQGCLEPLLIIRIYTAHRPGRRNGISEWSRERIQPSSIYAIDSRFPDKKRRTNIKGAMTINPHKSSSTGGPR
jgi:hypothetical protein